MKVLFVNCGPEKLGIGMLSAMARQSGHRVALAHDPMLFGDQDLIGSPLLRHLFSKDDAFIGKIAERRPDVLVFSPITLSFHWMAATAQRLKRELPESKILFGGPHVSALPEKVIALPYVDAIGIGEGEFAFAAYLDFLEGKRPAGPIDNLWQKTAEGRVLRGKNAPFIQDLDSLPFCDKRLQEDLENVGANYYIMTGRGCPLACTYCFNSYWSKIPDKPRGRYVRRRSVGNVLAELHAAKQRYGLRTVEFFDDTFTFNKPWTLDFLAAYRREIGVPFIVNTHPMYLDEEVIAALGAAGCEQVCLGIQSMDENYRHDMLQRRESNERIERSLTLLDRSGLPYSLDHILGFPDEPIESHARALECYGRHKPQRVGSFYLKYFPGTELTRLALARGWLTPAQMADLEDGKGHDYGHPGSLDNAHRSEFLRYDFLLRCLPIFGADFEKYVPLLPFKVLPEDFLVALSRGMLALSSIYRDNKDTKRYALFYLKSLLKTLGPDGGRRVGNYS